MQKPSDRPSRNSAPEIALLWRMGLQLESQGRSHAARAVWIQLLQTQPAHLGALSRLGGLLAASGENELARAVFAEAVRQHPRDAMSRVNLANLLLKDEACSEARLQLEQALAIDPNFRPAHAGLAFVLPRLDEPELGALHGRIAFAGRGFVEARFRGEGAPVRVLELISTRGGNVRIQSFLPDRIFQRFVLAAEFCDPDLPLPGHDLVVNAIGDADVAQAALAGAAALVARTDAPVLNRPLAVMATGRAEIARRLAAIAGVRTARMALVARQQLAGSEASVTLAELGFGFPLLLRSPGFHGGEHFTRVESVEALPMALEQLPGRELLAIEFLDAFLANGKARKYRAMTVGGKLYPLHCAVSHHWKIHYFSAEMAGSPENRAEDAAFLADMPGVLGAAAMESLEAIQAALQLDYGGIDFGLSRDGELLLFEANATMVILPPKPEPVWDYRRPAVERVCAAVHALLRSRAGLASARLGEVHER